MANLPVPSAALIILDGWGLAPDGPGNAISLAETPNFDQLREKYPSSTLSAQGPDVGLPEGQMGNSEVGHLNLGAGAIVKHPSLTTKPWSRPAGRRSTATAGFT